MNNNVMLLSFSMKQMRENQFRSYSYNPSLGIISLATWLEVNGFNPTAIDLGYTQLTLAQIVEKIRDVNPLFLGLSVYTENYVFGLQFAQAIKKNFPNLKIVLGGPHPSLCPDDVISCDAVDFVSLNEGECSLLELAEAIRTDQKLIKYSQIDGLLYKEDNKIIKNKVRKKIKDLDLLTIPKREYMGIENYKDVVSISTSRGCPGRCIYCSATALSGATYRFKNVDNVLLEMILINYQLKGNIIKIYVNDDTFTAEPSRIREFTKSVKKNNIKIPWHCESRIDVMNEELLDILSQSNCIMIQYGIESGSQYVLDNIHKNINLEYAKKVLSWTDKFGIKICLSFMIGHFCDTLETMEETCEFILEVYKKYHAEMALSFNTPFPGTWQYAHHKELGMKLTTEDYRHYNLGEPIVETDNFSLDDQMKYLYKMQPYLLRGEMIKQQMGELELC